MNIPRFSPVRLMHERFQLATFWNRINGLEPGNQIFTVIFHFKSLINIKRYFEKYCNITRMKKRRCWPGAHQASAGSPAYRLQEFER